MNSAILHFLRLHRFGTCAAVFAATITLLSGSVFAAAQSKPQPPSSSDSASAPQPPALLLGAAWYPEQWPESRWEKDLELMQKAHVHMVRIGEYSWTRDEPVEGQYHFDWMERAINLAGKHGIFVVIGTPSQAPPTWLTQKYPQVLRVTRDGQRVPLGNRANFNWSDPTYRRLVANIDRQLAKRFGHNPHVIAWQLDNEYGNVSYDAGTQQQFQQWLQKKYGTLDDFNQRLDMAYWSRTYSSWSLVPIPSRNGNPGLMLDWMRFVSDTWRSYQKNQIDALRPYLASRQRITTNMMGWFDGYNHYVVARDLDFASWDDPLGHWSNPFNALHNAAANDLARGLKNQNFWVMETTSGSNIAKGEMRAGVWQDIGHGADTTSYWQWRDSLNGQEQNHKGVLVGVDGTPAPEYAVWAQVGSDYEKAGPALHGTGVQSRVAILQSYDSRWTINWQRENPHYNPTDEILSYYQPLHALGYSIDVVSPSADLSHYGLVVAPGLNVMPQPLADHLSAYVRTGGHLVLGQRSGMKDWDNSRWQQRQPGPLAALLGGRVEQYFALRGDVPVDGEWGAHPGQLYAERLQVMAPDVQVLMRYGKSNGWLDGQPAAITRKAGKGSISYIGAWLDDPGMLQAARWMVKMSGVQPDLPAVPAGVQVERRIGAGKDVLLFQNFSSGPQSVALPSAMQDVLHGGSVQSIILPQYGVAVLQAASK